MNTIYHAARVLVAVIILQTVYFKLSGHPVSVELFSAIDMEPNGRIATGVIEIIAGLVLLLGGQFIWMGALLVVFLMIGAIYYHVMVLGIDTGFWMAVVALLLSLFILYYKRKSFSDISAK